MASLLEQHLLIQMPLVAATPILVQSAGVSLVSSPTESTYAEQAVDMYAMIVQ